MARPFGSGRRGGPGGRARGQALASRGKGRVGRGLNEAAEALLGMCVDAEEDPAQPVGISLQAIATQASKLVPDFDHHEDVLSGASAC